MIDPSEQLSIEDISSPIVDQIFDFTAEDYINFFDDDISGSDDSTGRLTEGNVIDAASVAAISPPAASGEGKVLCNDVGDLPALDRSACCVVTGDVTDITTAASASCESESLCCYSGDDASFDFDPATISSLLDYDQPSNYEPHNVIPATIYQLPATSGYSGEQNQDEINHLLLTNTINGGSWSQDSSDSVISSDKDIEALPGWTPWQCYNPHAMVALTEEQPIPLMPSLMGYMGVDSSQSCAFLDTNIISRYQSLSSGDGQMGFFHGRMMMGTETGIGAEGGEVGGVYGPESTQRIYSSIDMQVMRDYKSLVEGCNTTSVALPTSDITPLDDSTLKVARLSPEERKEKIHRYLKKRTERNFNKKIKYACRKTLADSRPRVRGRFAKNDEHGEGISRQSSSNHEYYDEEEVAVKEEEMLHSSNIFPRMGGISSFNYNYTLEPWI